MTDEIIEYGKDWTAHKTTVEGWVDKDGFFYGNKKDSEHRARLASCTHVRCDCGELMEKHKVRCQKCRDIFLKNQYESLEKRNWDNKTMLYSKTDDVFFDGEDELQFHCFKYERNPEDLQLVFCKKVELEELITDHWEHQFDADIQPPIALEKLIYEFNQKLKKIDSNLYEPTNIAAVVNLDED